MANGNGLNDTARKVAIGIIILAIGGAWGFAASRASEDDLEKVDKNATEVRRDVEAVNRRVDNVVLNQSAIIITLDGVARKLDAPGVPDKVLRNAERVTRESGVTR